MTKEAKKVQLTAHFAKLRNLNSDLKNALSETKKQHEKCGRIVQEQDEQLRDCQRHRYLPD